MVDATHPFRVAASEVIVDGHHVHTVAGERVEVTRQGRDEGLTFTGAHFGDVAVVESGTSGKLNVVVPLAQRARGRFANCGERLREQGVEGVLAIGQAGTELLGLASQFGIAEISEVRFQRVHHRGELLVLAEFLAFTGSQHLVE